MVNVRQNFRFYTENKIFVQNFEFFPKMLLWTNKLDFWPEFRLLVKICILYRNSMELDFSQICFDFWRKLNFTWKFNFTWIISTSIIINCPFNWDSILGQEILFTSSTSNFCDIYKSDWKYQKQNFQSEYRTTRISSLENMFQRNRHKNHNLIYCNKLKPRMLRETLNIFNMPLWRCFFNRPNFCTRFEKYEIVFVRRSSYHLKA